MYILRLNNIIYEFESDADYYFDIRDKGYSEYDLVIWFWVQNVLLIPIGNHLKTYYNILKNL